LQCHTLRSEFMGTDFLALRLHIRHCDMQNCR
jgi:hypothetical protein